MTLKGNKENREEIKAEKKKKKTSFRFIGHYHKTPFMFRDIKDKMVKSANIY